MLNDGALVNAYNSAIRISFQYVTELNCSTTACR